MTESVGSRNSASGRIRRAVGVVLGAVALLALTVLVLYQLAAVFGDGIPATVAATAITVAQTADGKGYVFRSERVLTEAQAGTADVLLEDGARVREGDELICYYAEAAVDTATLEQYDVRIAFLAACADTSGIALANLADLNREISKAYAQAQDAAADGDFQTFSRFADEMLIAASRKQTLATGDTGVTEALQALRAERQALLGQATGSALSPAAGNYFGPRSVDGYETLFQASSLLSMSGEGIAALLAATPDPVSASAGKLVTDFTWYLVFCTDRTTAEGLVAGKTYQVTLSEGAVTQTYPMPFVTVKYDVDGTAYAVFSCNRLPVGQALFRTPQVSVAQGSVEGYRIPTDALCEKDGVLGVYVLEDGEALFRLVTPVATYETYTVVAKADPAAEDYNVRLHANESVIVGGDFK